MTQKLDADLNVIQRSGIEIQIDPLTKDLDIIQKLDDEPNDVGGLSAQELKAKFDEAGNTIKEFINDSLIPQVIGADATEADRAAAEEARQENEAARQEAETARETAEEAREAAETQREANEDVRIAHETTRESNEAARKENELLRQSAEAQRRENETARTEAETARDYWADYDPEKAYVPGNKVYYQGSSYVNAAPCTGVPPTAEAFWQIIAKKGADSDETLSQEDWIVQYQQLAARVSLLELTQNPDAKGNPFTVTFGNLEGLSVTGVWNVAQKRIEF